jgi:hypothetical protein
MIKNVIDNILTGFYVKDLKLIENVAKDFFFLEIN